MGHREREGENPRQRESLPISSVSSSLASSWRTVALCPTTTSRRNPPFISSSVCVADSNFSADRNLGGQHQWRTVILRLLGGQLSFLRRRRRQPLPATKILTIFTKTP